MSSPGEQPRTSDRREDAVRRLEVAVAKQDRRRDQHDAALDTAREPAAYAQLCKANERVATRERWLNWLHENDY